MALKTTRWDSAEHLQTEEDIAAYLNAILEENDPALVPHALGVIARAKRIQMERKLGKKSTQSPFDIPGITTKATTEDILAAIRDSRSR